MTIEKCIAFPAVGASKYIPNTYAKKNSTIIILAPAFSLTRPWNSSSLAWNSVGSVASFFTGHVCGGTVRDENYELRHVLHSSVTVAALSMGILRRSSRKL